MNYKPFSLHAFRSADDRPRALVSGLGTAGAAAARTLAELGFALVLIDNDRTVLETLSDELGAKARFCDVASETSLLLFGAELDRIGPVDLLINAAGPGYVRMLGMLRVSQALAGRMRGGGRHRFIVNIAACHVPGELFSYASSDVAFRRMSAALGETLSDSGVEVLTSQSDTSGEIVLRTAERLLREWPAAQTGNSRDERAA